MYTMILEKDTGGQYLQTFGKLSQPNKAFTVLWDTRKDGDIPQEIQDAIGGLVRNNDVVTVDASKLAAVVAAKDTDKTKQDALKKTKKDLRDLDLSGPIADADVKKILKDILKVLKTLI